MAVKSALLDQMCDVVRRKGYSRETAKTYRHWCERYLQWLRDRSGQWQHPNTMIYTHVDTAGISSEDSPLDRLPEAV
ncbi:MAG: phage integrase N-terminal SAM-like domain-containing protein [Planctomycetaceae bacterium]|nr:phage integrase N-terminal SAM-like domain-containing protein [Planctomycetaceae bacterium]